MPVLSALLLSALPVHEVAQSNDALLPTESVADLSVMVINLLQRTDKWLSMDSRLRNLGVTPTRLLGVDVSTHPDAAAASPYILHGGHKLGDAGAALAHLKAWEAVAAANQTTLVLEDDEKPTDSSITACTAAMKSVRGDFDLILMNAHRPEGVLVDRELNLLHVPQGIRVAESKANPSNVWLSAYLLTPRGAQRLLDFFAAHPIDTDTLKLDMALVRSVPNMPAFDFFVIGTTNRFFHHSQADSDTRVHNSHSDTQPA